VHIIDFLSSYQNGARSKIKATILSV